MRVAVVLCHHAMMSKALHYVPVVLSLVVLGAHFLRDGNWIGVAVPVALIGLLFVRRPWVARLVQLGLILGALEWLRTLNDLVQVRIALGQPFTRMAVILGVVAVVAFCAALLFQTPTLKRVYRLNGKQ